MVIFRCDLLVLLAPMVLQLLVSGEVRRVKLFVLIVVFDHMASCPDLLREGAVSGSGCLQRVAAGHGRRGLVHVAEVRYRSEKRYCFSLIGESLLLPLQGRVVAGGRGAGLQRGAEQVLRVGRHGAALVLLQRHPQGERRVNFLAGTALRQLR